MNSVLSVSKIGRQTDRQSDGSLRTQTDFQQKLEIRLCSQASHVDTQQPHLFRHFARKTVNLTRSVSEPVNQ